MRRTNKIAKELMKVASELRNDKVADDIDDELTQLVTEILEEEKKSSFKYGDFLGQAWVDALPSRWSFKDGNIVLNMKRKGLPPSIQELEKATGKELSEKAIEEEWKFLLETIYDDLSDSFSYDEVVVIGRSGGWWGFKIDSDWFKIDEDVIKELVGDYLSKQDEADSFNWANNMDEIAHDIASSIQPIFLDDIDLSSEANGKLERFEEEIMSYVKDLESVSFWKEVIDSNPEVFEL